MCIILIMLTVNLTMLCIYFYILKPCCFCKSMSSQYDLQYHSIILNMYSQCVWFTDISGIAKMKQMNKKSSNLTHLKRLYPFAIVEEEKKWVNNLFLGLNYASMLLHEFTRHVEFHFWSVLCWITWYECTSCKSEIWINF